MKCSHCGEPLPSVSCRGCGEEIPDRSLFCCWCGKAVEKEEPADASERVPCPDGNCIGTLNEKGTCSICRKSYAGSAA